MYPIPTTPKPITKPVRFRRSHLLVADIILYLDKPAPCHRSRPRATRQVSIRDGIEIKLSVMGVGLW